MNVAFLQPAPDRVGVKICGLTRAADAEAVVAAGADAVGVVLYARSPRCVTLAEAVGWLSPLAGVVGRVALLVNPTRAEARRALDCAAIDALQLHGDESPAFVADLAGAGKPVFKALRIRGSACLQAVATYPAGPVLLDAYRSGAYGGTGHAFDWRLLEGFARPFILSGGLQPDTVGAAVRQWRPFGVDVSSGVESAPGRKDPTLVRAFVGAVRTATLPTPTSGVEPARDSRKLPVHGNGDGRSENRGLGG